MPKKTLLLCFTLAVLTKNITIHSFPHNEKSMHQQHCFTPKFPLASELRTQKEKILTIISHLEQYKQIDKHTAEKIRRLFTNIYKSDISEDDRQRELAIINTSIAEFFTMQYKAKRHLLDTIIQNTRHNIPQNPSTAVLIRISENTHTKLSSFIDTITSEGTTELADDIKRIEENNANELIGDELRIPFMPDQNTSDFAISPFPS